MGKVRKKALVNQHTKAVYKFYYHVATGSLFKICKLYDSCNHCPVRFDDNLKYNCELDRRGSEFAKEKRYIKENINDK